MNYERIGFMSCRELVENFDCRLKIIAGSGKFNGAQVLHSHREDDLMNASTAMNDSLYCYLPKVENNIIGRIFLLASGKRHTVLCKTKSLVSKETIQ